MPVKENANRSLLILRATTSFRSLDATESRLGPSVALLQRTTRCVSAGVLAGSKAMPRRKGTDRGRFLGGCDRLALLSLHPAFIYFPATANRNVAIWLGAAGRVKNIRLFQGSCVRIQ